MSFLMFVIWMFKHTYSLKPVTSMTDYKGEAEDNFTLTNLFAKVQHVIL